MRYQPDRERNWRAWLTTTAEWEAWRLAGVERGHVSFELPDQPGSEWDPPAPHDEFAIRARLREALDALAKVPNRRRRVKAPAVTGFSYASS